LGKRLVMGEPLVNIFGEPHEVRAEVVVLNSFSGHADRNEILSYIGRFTPRAMRSVFLVHGDPDQEDKLGEGFRAKGFRTVRLPVRGEKAELT
jgi:metallo-beta-lactamase family protein